MWEEIWVKFYFVSLISSAKSMVVSRSGIVVWRRVSIEPVNDRDVIAAIFLLDNEASIMDACLSGGEGVD